MNRSFLVALLSVIMVVLMSPASYASWSTAVPPHGFCDNCHALQTVNNTPGATNGCVECHSSTGFASRTPVGNPGEMSNRFGTTPNEPTKGSKSTHNYKNYVYSPSLQVFPYAPASKAAEPLAGSLLNDATYNRNYSGVVTCQRCHNVHNATRNVTYGVDKPFMREPTPGDELCRDCHLSRWNTTTQQGSHPVAYRPYSSVYKLATTAFRRVPTSPNPTNYTSKMGNYLKNGKVVCSTCHSVHYGDSNSATLDNRSTANGSILGGSLKNLEPASSKGNLLRTDAYGPNADETNINICSSCHKETKNRSHNGSHQNIQCMNCHSAHVDYTADGSDPNMYLLRRTLTNISTGTKGRINPTLRYNAQSGMYFKNYGQGVCELCHTPPAGVTPEHDDPTFAVATYANCQQCHDHKNGFSGGGCTTCHGQPPLGTTADKAAANYTKFNEAVTPHRTHAANVQDSTAYAFACKECHYETKPMTRIDLHAKGSFQSIFEESVGTIGTKAGFSNVPGDYNASTTTCANVYCHSNGNPRGGPFVTQPPKWSDGLNSITQAANHCDRCHGGLAGGAAPIATNAHTRHVTGYSIKCATCHSATVDTNNAITPNGKTMTHANGDKEVAFSTPAGFVGSLNGSFTKSDATCSVKCHTDGANGNPLRSPIWTELAQNKGTAYCGSCHAAAPATSLHTVHLTGTKGPLLGTASTVCNTCHIYSDGALTHANGTTDLKANTCSTCHPTGTPLWLSGQTVSCDSCHVNSVSSVTNSTGTYSTSSLQMNDLALSRHGGSNTCTTACHDASAPHIGAAVGGEKRLQQTFSGPQQCSLCHTTASTSAFKAQSTARLDIPSHGGIGTGFNTFSHYTSTISNNKSKYCATCHDPHSKDKYMIRATINGIAVNPLSNMSTGFIDKVGTGGVYKGLCQVCHTKTGHFRNNSYMGNHNGDKWCLSCHNHKGLLNPDGTPKPGTFAFQPGDGCNACHGYPPVTSMTSATLGQLGFSNRYSTAKLQNYSGGGGVHAVEGHLPKSLKMSDTSVCNTCHLNNTHNQGNGTVKPSNVNVQVDPKFRFNKGLSITYDGVQNDNRTLYKVGSCSNVSCHFKPTPKWSTQKN